MERKICKLNRYKMFILFNKTYLKEQLLLNYMFVSMSTQVTFKSFFDERDTFLT